AAAGINAGASAQINREFLEIGELAVVERAFVRGGEDDARRGAGLERLLPARRAEAPAVAGPEAREAVFRHRRGEIVSGARAEGEELGRHQRADRMRSHIFAVGVAAAVAEEAG